MMSADIDEVHHYITEIEDLVKQTSSKTAILAKCQEAKSYIGLLKGALMPVEKQL